MTWAELITDISIGSILDLKTKYKDVKSNNIGLDFYGFDAVLPLKEISNNHDLSFLLFNTLKKGEIISLVLIDIDEINRKLTFSTKVFRNALDDILSFTRCKYLVDNNRNTHLRIHSKFLNQNRNILDRLCRPSSELMPSVSYLCRLPQRWDGFFMITICGCSDGYYSLE